VERVNGRLESEWTGGVELVLGLPFGSLPTRDAHIVVRVRKDLLNFKEYEKMVEKEGGQNG